MKVKFYIAILLFLMANFSNAQKLGFGIQIGSEVRSITNHTIEKSRFNDSTYQIQYTPGNVMKAFFSLNFYDSDETGFDFLFGYNRMGGIIYDPTARDTFGIQRFLGNEIGNTRIDIFDVHMDRYLPLAKRNERLIIRWGYGLNLFYTKAEATNITKPNLVFNQRRIYAGVTPKVLSKLTYASKNKRFLIEGVLAYNVANFAYYYNRNFDPNLTIRQQTNTIFDFDIPTSINGRLGFVFLISKKKDSEKNTEKTNE